jgi:hypothetical protein
MEAYQMLRVDIRIAGSFGDERSLARMTKDGRLTIPKLTFSKFWVMSRAPSGSVVRLFLGF